MAHSHFGVWTKTTDIILDWHNDKQPHEPWREDRTKACWDETNKETTMSVPGMTKEASWQCIVHVNCMCLANAAKRGNNIAKKRTASVELSWVTLDCSRSIFDQTDWPLPFISVCFALINWLCANCHCQFVHNFTNPCCKLSTNWTKNIDKDESDADHNSDDSSATTLNQSPSASRKKARKSSQSSQSGKNQGKAQIDRFGRRWWPSQGNEGNDCQGHWQSRFCCHQVLEGGLFPWQIGSLCTYARQTKPWNDPKGAWRLVATVLTILRCRAQQASKRCTNGHQARNASPL